jgi:hypothetical protein
MRLITWKRVGVIASVIWVVVGPTYFHLSREDNDKRIARDQYQLCIKQAWVVKGGVERYNKELRQALAIARWSSWALLAFVPVLLAWLIGWAMLFLARKARSKPQRIAETIRGGSASAENDDSAENHFLAPWTVKTIPEGFRVIDANGQSLAYVFSRATPNDAQFDKVLTEGEAKRIASNIAELPKLLGKR